MDKNTGSVAVVDDEENIRETVAYALRREGYHVISTRMANTPGSGSRTRSSTSACSTY